jgi:hypothetical protein
MANNKPIFITFPVMGINIYYNVLLETKSWIEEDVLTKENQSTDLGNEMLEY